MWYFCRLTQQHSSRLGSGGPQLLLNTLVLSTLSSAAQPRPLLCSPPLHQRVQRSQRAQRAMQPLKTAQTPANSSASLQKPVLCSVHCFDFSLSGSGDGAVEDFTRLDDSPLGTLYHTEWKERVMYYAGGTELPLKIAILAWLQSIRCRKQLGWTPLLCNYSRLYHGGKR